MIFGAGLVAGLLGQVGRALGEHTLSTIAHTASWMLPFEALYQFGLHSLTSGIGGFTGVAVRLGPFGGAQGFDALLWPYAVAYFVVLGALAGVGFARRDL
jgi:hypothetical protein